MCTACGKRTVRCARPWGSATRIPILLRAAQDAGGARTVERVAPTNSTVLLGGESGVGKDLIARGNSPEIAPGLRAVHQDQQHGDPGKSAGKRTVRLRERRVYGRYGSKPGKFELADKGTLFLDEIGDVPPVDPGKVVARAAGARIRAAGRHSNHQGGCAPDRRHQPRSARRTRAGYVPRGSLLSP